MQDAADTMLAFVDVERLKTLPVLPDVAEKDTMCRHPSQRNNYFFVGRQNLFTIYNLLNTRCGFIPKQPRVGTVLDFGCGYGRVTRWLRAGFPDAVIHGADIDKAGVEWCAERLGVVPVDHPVPNYYDLIWVGSVFTHLTQDQARTLMAELLGALAPGGILAITTLGRAVQARMQTYDWAQDKFPAQHFNLDKARFDKLLDGFVTDGYGYVPYPNAANYGMCVARPSWYADLALAHQSITQIAFIERADGAQDVSAFLRLDLTDASRGMLWR